MGERRKSEREMSTKGGPDLRRYMDKKLALKLNAGRRVTGILRGFDQFMNLVLDETIEEVSASERNEIGMVVIRGNSVTMMECLERTIDYIAVWKCNQCVLLSFVCCGAILVHCVCRALGTVVQDYRNLWEGCCEGSEPCLSVF